MKTIITLAAVAIAFGNPAFAQTTKKKKTTVKTVVTEPAASAPVATTPTYSSGNILTKTPVLSFDLGLGSVGSKFIFGAALHAEAPVNYDGNHFRFGGQTGFYYGPSQPHTWIVPVLATGIYDFQVSGALKPYAGLGIGLSFTHVSFDGLSDTSTDFTFVVKPGVNFGDDQKFYFEIPFGTMSSAFVILPSVGAHF